MPSTDAAAETGTLDLVFSRKAEGILVTLDGTLVVRRASAKEVQVRNAPAGYAQIAVAADGVERQMRIWIEAGKTTTVPIGAAPTPASRNPAYAAGISILAYLVSRSLNDLLF